MVSRLSYAQKVYEKCIEVFSTQMTLLFTSSKHKSTGKSHHPKLMIKVVKAIRLLLVAVMNLSMIYSKTNQLDHVAEVLVFGEWFVNRSLPATTRLLQARRRITELHRQLLRLVRGFQAVDAEVDLS